MVGDDVELGLPSLSLRVVGEKMGLEEPSQGVQPGGGTLPALAKAFTVVLVNLLFIWLLTSYMSSRAENGR